MLILVVTFFEDPSRKFGLLRRMVAHWIDKAIAEYSEARDLLLAQIEEQKRPLEELQQGRLIYMMNFADCMEHSLTLTRRLLRAVDHVKGLPLAQIDRETRRYIEAQSQDLTGVRDVIEHLVETALGSKWPENGSLFPRLTEAQDGVEVGGRVVTFAQLSATLRRIHAIAQRLVDTESGLEPSNAKAT